MGGVGIFVLMLTNLTHFRNFKIPVQFQSVNFWKSGTFFKFLPSKLIFGNVSFCNNFNKSDTFQNYLNSITVSKIMFLERISKRKQSDTFLKFLWSKLIFRNESVNHNLNKSDTFPKF